MMTPFASGLDHPSASVARLGRLAEFTARGSGCDNQRLRILHAIHDFLPRHQAGSEIYAFELCRALSATHDVTVLCASYDPSRPHGDVIWRVHEGLPVIEIVNNWECAHLRRDLPAAAHRRAHRGRPARRAAGRRPRPQPAQPLVRSAGRGAGTAASRSSPRSTTTRWSAPRAVSGSITPSSTSATRSTPNGACAAFASRRSSRRLHSACWLRHRAPRSLQRAAAALVAPAAGVAATVAAAAAETLALADDAGGRRRPPCSGRARSSTRSICSSRRRHRSRRSFERLGVRPSKIRVSDYGFVPIDRRIAPSGAGNAGRPRGRSESASSARSSGTKAFTCSSRPSAGSPPLLIELKIFGSPDVFPGLQRRTCAPARPACRFRSWARSIATQTADVYAQIDVLVVPSLWLENSPLVIHEAFMAGIPVVGARIGGIADLVEDGRHGTALRPTSPRDLAAALRRPDRESGTGRARWPSAPGCNPRVKSIAERRPRVGRRPMRTSSGAGPERRAPHELTAGLDRAADAQRRRDASRRCSTRWRASGSTFRSRSSRSIRNRATARVELLRGRVDQLIGIPAATFDHGLTRNLGIERATRRSRRPPRSGRGSGVRFVAGCPDGAAPGRRSRSQATFARQRAARPTPARITRHYLERWVASSSEPRIARDRQPRRARGARSAGAARTVHLRQRLFLHQAIDLAAASVPPDADRRRPRVGARSAPGGLSARLRAGGGSDPLARSLRPLRVRPDLRPAPPPCTSCSGFARSQRLPLLARAIASSLTACTCSVCARMPGTPSPRARSRWRSRGRLASTSAALSAIRGWKPLRLRDV